MSRIKTKDFDYFNYFSECTEIANQAANFLHDSLSQFDINEVTAKVEEMHNIENTADMKKHEMLKHLAHEFMTPIEREDIVALSQQIDNVVDAIDDVMTRVYMFNIKKIRPELLSFTSLIVTCCEALTTAVKEMGNFKKSKTIHGHIITVNSIESEGDLLYKESMHKLFNEDNDALDVIVWTTMFECLENCFDGCEDVADIIESIIMKNT